MADSDETVTVQRVMGALDPEEWRYWDRVQAYVRDFEELLGLAPVPWAYDQDPSLALQWLCRQYFLLLGLYYKSLMANGALRETLMEVQEDHLAALHNLVTRSEEDTDGTQ